MILSILVYVLLYLVVLKSAVLGYPLKTDVQHISKQHFSSSIRFKALQGQRNIMGQNIVNCRKFSIREPKTFKFTGSYATLNSVPQVSFPDVAFVGKSNVGKSSLLNALTGLRKKIAVEGRTPGTTQYINIFQCGDCSGPICNFVDLPGYGFAKLSDKQQSGISSFMRDYLLARGSLKLVLMLVDSRREADAADLDMLQFLLEEGLRVVVVATKVDKLTKSELTELPQRLRGGLAPAVQAALEGEGAEAAQKGASDLPVVLCSAATGLGKGSLWRVIHDNLLADEDEDGDVSAGNED